MSPAPWRLSRTSSRRCRNSGLPGGAGRSAGLERPLPRPPPLLLDVWARDPLDTQPRHDLLEILEDRYGRRSTIVTSQLPVAAWHEVIGNPIYADAILDRLYGQLLGGIALERGLTEVELAEKIDRAPFLSQEALAEGLIDELMYYDEVRETLTGA